MRLIDAVVQLGLTQADARRALSSGKVCLRGVPVADPGREVDVKQVTFEPRRPRLDPARDPAIVFHDADLLVVHKPTGLLSVPAPGRRRERDVIGALGRQFGTLLPVHRLDEETSGLLMIARSKAVQTRLKDALEKHAIERTYVAVVSGTFPAKPITCDTVIVRNRGDGLRGSVDAGDRKDQTTASRGPQRRKEPTSLRATSSSTPARDKAPLRASRRSVRAPLAADEDEGKRAITHFRKIEAWGRHATLIEARLETGRTHQVRIHASELGHPVLGEPLYAPRGVANAAPRMLLHARELRLAHPTTGTRLVVFAPWPDDFERVHRRLLGRD